jgi:phenylacetate-CoA ligase
LNGLKWTVQHAYAGSDFYRKKFNQAAIRPEDLRSLDDIVSFPFTTADDLRDDYPFPLRSVPFEKIVRIHTSTGSTGKRKVLCYTKKDIDDWADFFARCYEMVGAITEDRIQVAVGYGLWSAGAGFQIGAERFGALTIPAGPGNLDLQCQLMEDLGTTVLCATGSMALLMAEEIGRRGLRGKIALRKIIFGAEPCSEAMRGHIEELTGAETFEIYGLTELYGPGTAIECARHQGMHYWADYYLIEIIDPKSLKPLPEGEKGEIVITTLRKEASPLIRYRTRDLSYVMPQACPCGSVLPLHGRISGRTDDMFTIRGVNVYPSHVSEICAKVPGVGSEYRILLQREKDGKDYMTIQIERAEKQRPEHDGAICKSIEEKLKAELLVSGKVEVVDYGSLPRTERKTKRVFDNR